MIKNKPNLIFIRIYFFEIKNKDQCLWRIKAENTTFQSIKTYLNY